MANFFQNLNTDELIAAAEDNSIDSLVTSVVSMASQLNVSQLMSDMASHEQMCKRDFSDSDSDEHRSESGGDDSNSLKNRNMKRTPVCLESKADSYKTYKEDLTGLNRVPKLVNKNLLFDTYECYGNSSFKSNAILTSTPSFTKVVTTDIVEEIEDDLEFYEKVSLVFLLYDSDDLALQRLKIAFRSFNSGSITHCRLLSDWAMHETSDNWQAKFIETLCIIKNVMWVRKLGFSIEEMNLRFLPQNPEVSLHVDLLRKALYIVCESLAYKQLEKLQILVSNDMENEGRILDKYDVEFMEMNILHWMSQRYLNVGIVGSCDINIKNLTKHLKVMEEYRLVDYLEAISRSCCKSSDNALVDPSLSDQLSVKSEFSQGGVSSHSVVSQCQEESRRISADTNYIVDPKNVGFCVIINQKNFYKESNPDLKDLVHPDYLESRVGTDIDRDRLCEIFMSYGFNVQIWENLTHIELVQAIHESATKLVKKEHSCFALCILSHGRRNAVYGVNSIAVEMEEIQKLLCGKYCPNLLYKPKIIIVQACQGLVKQNAYVTDLVEDGTSQSKTSPEVSDMITFWATVPGYAAFRDRITGSWFVQALWEEMLQKRNIGNDLLSIFVNVNAQVCNKRAPINGELKAMTPLFAACLRKKLIFPFHHEARKAAAKRMFERYLFHTLVTEFIESRLLKDENIS